VYDGCGGDDGGGDGAAVAAALSDAPTHSTPFPMNQRRKFVHGLKFKICS